MVEANFVHVGGPTCLGILFLIGWPLIAGNSNSCSHLCEFV